MVVPAGAMTHHPAGVIPRHPAGSENRAVRTRRIAAVTLLVFGTIFWIAFGFGIWAKRQALDTDNWVDTSGKLLENENIRTTLGVFVVDQLYNSEATQQRLEQVLPPELSQLAGPASAGLKEIASRNAPRLLGTDGRPHRLGAGQPQGARNRARDRGRRPRREGGDARPGRPVHGGRERDGSPDGARSTRSRRTSRTSSWPRPTRSDRRATGSTCSRRSSGCCWAWRSPASPARSR